jgi:hypothetical protein
MPEQRNRRVRRIMRSELLEVTRIVFQRELIADVPPRLAGAALIPEDQQMIVREALLLGAARERQHIAIVISRAAVRRR